MKYSYEFKMKAVELYRQGKWIDTPEGLSPEAFRKEIGRWDKIIKSCGSEALKHNNQNKVWTAEERYELVARCLNGEAITPVALTNGINSGQLYTWVQKYKKEGYNGLVMLKRGRPPKDPNMKKTKAIEPKPLNESEREELIQLRERIKYFEAENEALKKEMALRHEKWAADLKAKKQRSSKNSEKKDIS